jgi:uncharacterized protein
VAVGLCRGWVRERPRPRVPGEWGFRLIVGHRPTLRNPPPAVGGPRRISVEPSAAPRYGRGMVTADELIAALDLRPLPLEGGYYRETYRSADLLPAGALPTHYGAPRCAGTAIYYLLTPGTCSALHRLASDEIFHFYLGGPVRMLQLFPDGQGREIILGPDLLNGQSPQVVVPRGVWQGSVLEPGVEFALVGCTVAPGFEYADYEHANRAKLLARYPAFAELIKRLTPEGK